MLLKVMQSQKFVLPSRNASHPNESLNLVGHDITFDSPKHGKAKDSLYLKQAALVSDLVRLFKQFSSDLVVLGLQPGSDELPKVVVGNGYVDTISI
jgi:hypothetical protein